MTDGQLIPTPAEAAPAPEAWATIALQLGDLTTEMRRDRASRLKPMPAKHPSTASGVVASDGTLTLDLGGPSMGRQWVVRRLVVVDTDQSWATGGGAATANSGTYAAQAAGSILLPAGASMTGFDVTSEEAAAVVHGLVTATNLATANLNFDYVYTTNGQQLQVRFPDAIGPSSATATPQVNMAAVTGGSAYAMTVYGLTAQTGAVDGTATLHATASPVLTSTTEVWNLATLPARERFTSETITVLPPEHLYLSISGGTDGQGISARVDVLDFVAPDLTGVQDL